MINACRTIYEVGFGLIHDERTGTRTKRLHAEAKVDCLKHLGSIQNLLYLATLEGDHPLRVQSHLRGMEKHLHDLSESMQSF